MQINQTAHGNFFHQHENVCCTEISHLSVKSGRNVILNDVNLHLHCGELTAIVGRNGAGKTTLIKSLLGIIPFSGNVKFHSNHKTSKPHGKPRIGYVPQSLSTEKSSPVTVGDVIVASLSRWPVWLPKRTKDKKLISDVLASVNANDLAERKITELSGGELQRIMLSLAINPVPEILLLDEPVSGVDRSGTELFYNLVNELRKKYDTTVLLISHDLDLIAKHADRVVLIDRGIAAVGTVAEVYNSEPFIKTFGKIVIED